jgi:transcriptional regulator with XRE-family HTH domain
MTELEDVRRRVLGAILSQRRAAMLLSQSELATRVGTNQGMISRIERGVSPVDMFLARQLVLVLEMTLEGMFRLVEIALARTATVVLGVCGDKAHANSWWVDAEHIGGYAGLDALITFAVAAVLSESTQLHLGGSLE